MTQCVRPDCTGAYDPDGYCEECGRKAPRGTPGQPHPVSAAQSSTAGPGVSGPTVSGPTVSGPTVSGPTTSSGSRRTRGSQRGRLGAGLLDLPRIPVRDPASAVLADPQVPEARRFCGNPDCAKPVGRSRDGQPGRAEGFCSHCRNPFSFVPKLSPGTKLGGRYEVLGCLAHGGLGWIYLARDRNVGDTVTERWVVLKGLIDTGDPDAMAAAVTERRFLVEVDHPAIVKIHDFVSHPDPRTGTDVGYIVMEYVGGRSLKDIRLDRTGNGDPSAPLPLTEVIAYGLEMLGAFGYLHERGLLYCDFKPDNAIHTEDRIKLVDLGAVRRMDDDVSAVWGTVGYQAPDVATSGPSITTDLYTIARTMAVLSLDFKGFSTRYADRLPPASDHPLLAQQESYHRLLLRATHADPAYRFESAGELSEQLLGVLRQVLASADGVPRPALSNRFTVERAAFGTAAGLSATASTVDRSLTAADVVAALPVPQADPTDPGAAILLTVTGTDLAALEAAAKSAPADSAEVPFALVRARISHGDPTGARALLGPLAAADPYDWRVTWYRGLAALAAGDAAAARTEFDSVYDTLPGELAPQLALAATAELTGDTTAALRRYRQVWQTDRGFVSAAFGIARILVGQGDRAGAITVLDGVPHSSNQHLPAQIAAARAQYTGPPARLTVIDLTGAAARIQQLRLDVERQAGLTVELLDAALGWLGQGSNPHGSGTVLGHPLTERGLRLGLEQAYRVLAKLAPDADTRISLVDRANQVRPRTWW